jgi:hypothetical protein
MYAADNHGIRNTHLGARIFQFGTDRRDVEVVVPPLKAPVSSSLATNVSGRETSRRSLETSRNVTVEWACE